MWSLVRCMQGSPMVHIFFLQAVLGEKHSATLGVAAGGRDLRMQTVLKAVKEAPHQRISVLHVQIHHVFFTTWYETAETWLCRFLSKNSISSYFIKFINALLSQMYPFFFNMALFHVFGGQNSWGTTLQIGGFPNPRLWQSTGWWSKPMGTDQAWEVHVKNVTNFLDFQHFHWKVIYIPSIFQFPIIFEVGE